MSNQNLWMRLWTTLRTTIDWSYELLSSDEPIGDQARNVRFSLPV